jgi:hypothetical protein
MLFFHIHKVWLLKPILRSRNAYDFHFHFPLETYTDSEVAQSAQCLTTDWPTVVRSPAEARNLSSSLCVQIGCGSHPASCTVGTTGVLSPRVKRGWGVTLTIHPHLQVPRLRMSRSYIFSLPWRLHGVAGQLSEFQQIVRACSDLLRHTTAQCRNCLSLAPCT